MAKACTIVVSVFNLLSKKNRQRAFPLSTAYGQFYSL